MAKFEQVTCVCGEAVDVEDRPLATGCHGCGQVWERAGDGAKYFAMIGPHKRVREVEIGIDGNVAPVAAEAEAPAAEGE